MGLGEKEGGADGGDGRVFLRGRSRKPQGPAEVGFGSKYGEGDGWLAGWLGGGRGSISDLGGEPMRMAISDSRLLNGWTIALVLFWRVFYVQRRLVR